jgi:hypothetical protein
MSWSYTAGAYYRLKSVFGNLIFGGYDASRFTPNHVVFTMTGDNLRDIVVTIRGITATTGQGNTTLMSSPEFAFIDSAVPEIWLPVDVCHQFEKAFGLEVDLASGLYLLNDTTHQNLLNMNPKITFTLANEKSGGVTTDIVLPYGAFDLNVTAPVVINETSYYFPIRSTSDDTLYTLGRTLHLRRHSISARRRPPTKPPSPKPRVRQQRLWFILFFRPQEAKRQSNRRDRHPLCPLPRPPHPPRHLLPPKTKADR